MKIGIIGTGMIVKDLMTTIEKLDFSYIAILGTKETEEETKAISQKYGVNEYFLDYDKMLASDIDTVYIALPNHLHSSFAKKALLNDKHVIIEKPITVNAGQLKELIQVAEEHHRMIFEAMNIHYLPTYHALKQEIEHVGDIKIVSLNYSQYSSRYDKFKAGEVLPAFDPMKAGGALMDLNIYNVHLIVGMFGKPKRVMYQANIERGIDTSGILTLDYETFKVVAIGAKDCKAPVLCSIQGGKGCIVIPKPVNQMDCYEVLLNNGETKKYNVEKPEHRLYYEFVEFQNMIEHGEWERQKLMLNISLYVSEILEEARRQNGIVVDL